MCFVYCIYFVCCVYTSKKMFFNDMFVTMFGTVFLKVLVKVFYVKALPQESAAAVARGEVLRSWCRRCS